MNKRHQFRDGEKHLSQIPALHLLQTMAPKWVMLSKAEVDRERRGKLSNVLLEDILRAQLMRLNAIEYRGRQYPFSESNIQTAIERLRSREPLGLMRLNELTTDLLQLGTSLDQPVEGDTRGRSLKYIDWANPANNTFHVCKEFDVDRTGSAKTRRPDIVLFVNGIPFCVIECKGPNEDFEEAISQNLRNQGPDEIPHLFRSVQLLIATNRNKVRYGTVGTSRKFWALWREKEFSDTDIGPLLTTPLTAAEAKSTFGDGFEEERAPFERLIGDGREVTEQDRVLYALCRPDRLLDLARRFTLFDLGIKKVARYQQFFAVKNILSKVKQRDSEGRRQGGVIWHTQGSGKSLTMVMLARALALDPEIVNPRIVLVTDRIDLDEQLKGTFAACGAEPENASSGRHLLKLVSQDRASIIATVINKFDTALNIRDYRDLSSDVFLLIDESHRGQYGEMHTRMKRMFPNACYLGFTGTPLMKKEKSTAVKFGGLIDIYAIDQAVKDGAVVPLLYEGRHVEQDVNREGIDVWFERVSRNLTPDQRADLKRKFARYSEIGQTEPTIYCIAYDVSEHFAKNWKGTGFKAQLATRSKRAALLYKRALDQIGMVTSEVIISAPDDREGYDEVGDESREEVVRFWKKMMERYGDEKSYNRSIVASFKDREDPEILIVVDKLLTGFDAPKNTVLYLDKPLKAHGLLQAIARVNRVDDDKEYGYIIDYAGVLGELDPALKTYSALAEFEAEDLQGVVTQNLEEIEKLPQRQHQLWDLFKELPNKLDEESFERHLGDEERREDFYERLAQFARTLAIALSTSDWINDPRNESAIASYKEDLRRFQKLRTSVRKRYQEDIDFKLYEERVRKLLDQHIHANEVITLTAPVNIFDEKAFEEAVGEQVTPASKADMIASLTQRTITERMEEDPVYFEKISALIQKAIDDHRAQRISQLEFLNIVRDAREQVVRPRHDDVPQHLRGNDTAVAFYHAIEKHLAAVAPGTDVRADAGEAAEAMLDIIARRRVVNWAQRDDIQNEMRNDLDDYLFDVMRDGKGHPLTPDSMDEIIDRILSIARTRMPD
ncbi:type I restriction endonuclease subunit R [Bradyrhizobium diazoefficiens]